MNLHQTLNGYVDFIHSDSLLGEIIKNVLYPKLMALDLLSTEVSWLVTTTFWLEHVTRPTT